MKRGGFLKRRTPFKVKGTSDTAHIKQDIQDIVRDIVILRDGGCILRNVQGIGPCNGYAKNGHLILQADHLITRANSATYADTRLIVCLCKGHHGGFKKWHEREYNALVRTLLSKDRVTLWDRAEQDSWRPKRTGLYDWQLSLVALKAELDALKAMLQSAV